MSAYKDMMKKLAQGWNTWNTRSVLSHVLLPDGFALNLCFKEHATGSTWKDHYLKEAQIGRFGEHEEKLHPGAHAYDGSYTQLNMKWKGTEFNIESAVHNQELVLLVTPVINQKYPVTLVVESGMLWNRPGQITLDGDKLVAVCPDRTIETFATKALIREYNVPCQTPYMAIAIEGPVGLSTGHRRTLAEITAIVAEHKWKHDQSRKKYGELAETYNAMQTCLAWDTIYDPSKDRVISPVSRMWNVTWGGYVLFCWDTYFAAWLSLLDNKELSYANVIEVTREKTERGFVPNYAGDPDFKSRDRSQPPVGSMTALALYERYGDRWFLEELFEDLYVWNQWWFDNRVIQENLLAWGSNPFEPVFGGLSEIVGVGDTHGAALESGLDNSPMYDDIPFNYEKYCMELADVGLNGLYIRDCQALAKIADVLGRVEEAEKLRARADQFATGLAGLWDDASGFFLNKRTDTGEFSTRKSPTNFYALFSDKVSEQQASRMIDEHFYNPDEFWGEWIMPSISRDDANYKDQFYWRGRIWAPMNFLAYLAMRQHNLAGACKDLAAKSKNLIMKEWLELGHVHENYCAESGEGCNASSSDKFYHWGALLSLITLIDAGWLDQPLSTEE